jgi:hypothetical protein
MIAWIASAFLRLGVTRKTGLATARINLPSVHALLDLAG